MTTRHRWIYAAGGGLRPQEGMRRAVHHSRMNGGPDVRACVIAYASEHPETYLETFGAQLAFEGVATPAALLRGPSTPAEIAEATRRIRQATLLCLSGGDQNVAMRFFREPTIRAALIERYQAGAPFITTSAGTALLTEVMMTGETPPTSDGLGLLTGLVLEQHFVTCAREPRVIELLTSEDNEIRFVVGPDEDAMLEICDETIAEVIGEQYVFVYERGFQGIERYALGPGDRLDLKTRERLLHRAGTPTAKAGTTPLARRLAVKRLDESAGW